MEIVYLVVLNALGHLAFVGARMTTSLFALELSATEFTVGLLMALFALLPMLLSVSAGRLIDRVGPRRPLAVGLAVLAAATALPFAWPNLATLYVSSTLVGTAFMYLHISMNSVFGAYGTPEERAVNFSWLALAFSVSNTVGPLVAGTALDLLGHAAAMLVLSVFPVIALVLLWARKKPLPRPERPPLERRSSVLELLREHKLRDILIVSGVLAVGWDLYNFLIPIYGAQRGLSAATIGAILSTFALATFAVRLFRPLLLRRIPQPMVILWALCASGAAYLMMPFVASVTLLMALSFLLGLGLGCAQPVIMARLYEASPPGRQGEAVGVRTLLLNGSHTFIPILSGALSAVAGMTPVFWLIASFLLGGGWFARRRIRDNGSIK